MIVSKNKETGKWEARIKATNVFNKKKGPKLIFEKVVLEDLPEDVMAEIDAVVKPYIDNIIATKGTITKEALMDLVKDINASNEAKGLRNVAYADIYKVAKPYLDIKIGEIEAQQVNVQDPQPYQEQYIPPPNWFSQYDIKNAYPESDGWKYDYYPSGNISKVYKETETWLVKDYDRPRGSNSYQLVNTTYQTYNPIEMGFSDSGYKSYQKEYEEAQYYMNSYDLKNDILRTNEFYYDGGTGLPNKQIQWERYTNSKGRPNEREKETRYYNEFGVHTRTVRKYYTSHSSSPYRIREIDEIAGKTVSLKNWEYDPETGEAGWQEQQFVWKSGGGEDSSFSILPYDTDKNGQVDIWYVDAEGNHINTGKSLEDFGGVLPEYHYQEGYAISNESIDPQTGELSWLPPAVMDDLKQDYEQALQMSFATYQDAKAEWDRQEGERFIADMQNAQAIKDAEIAYIDQYNKAVQQSTMYDSKGNYILSPESSAPVEMKALSYFDPYNVNNLGFIEPEPLAKAKPLVYNPKYEEQLVSTDIGPLSEQDYKSYIQYKEDLRKYNNLLNAQKSMDLAIKAEKNNPNNGTWEVLARDDEGRPIAEWDSNKQAFDLKKVEVSLPKSEIAKILEADHFGHYRVVWDKEDDKPKFIPSDYFINSSGDALRRSEADATSLQWLKDIGSGIKWKIKGLWGSKQPRNVDEQRYQDAYLRELNKAKRRAEDAGAFTKVSSYAQSFNYGVGDLATNPYILTMPVWGSLGTTAIEGARTQPIIQGSLKNMLKSKGTTGVPRINLGSATVGHVPTGTALKTGELAGAYYMPQDAIAYANYGMQPSFWGAPLKWTAEKAMALIPTDPIALEFQQHLARLAYSPEARKNEWLSIVDDPMYYGVQNIPVLAHASKKAWHTVSPYLSLKGGYKLDPHGVTIDKYRKKEFKDLSQVTRYVTKDNIPLKKQIALESVEGMIPKLARDLRTFLSKEKSGFMGGSTVHQSIKNVNLARKPQDIEWYTNDRSFGDRLSKFAKSKGYNVKMEQGKVYVNGVKFDINPEMIGVGNIKSVTTGNPSKFIIKSQDGINLIDPKVVVRRSLVGAFEKGSKSNEPMARYSKDMPRLFTVSNEIMKIIKDNIGLKRFSKLPSKYRYGVIDLIFNRYLPPKDVSRLAPIKYRGYEQKKIMKKPLTKMDAEVIDYIMQKGGYIGGSSSAYLQMKNFRKYGDIDAYFKSGANIEGIAEGAMNIVKKHKKGAYVEKATSHYKIKDKSGKDIYDFGIRGESGDSILTLDGIRMRRHNQILQDKKAIIKALEAKKSKKGLNEKDSAKLKKAYIDVEYLEGPLARQNAEYTLRNKYPYIKAFKYVLPDVKAFFKNTKGSITPFGIRGNEPKGNYRMPYKYNMAGAYSINPYTNPVYRYTDLRNKLPDYTMYNVENYTVPTGYQPEYKRQGRYNNQYTPYRRPYVPYSSPYRPNVPTYVTPYLPTSEYTVPYKPDRDYPYETQGYVETPYTTPYPYRPDIPYPDYPYYPKIPPPDHSTQPVDEDVPKKSKKGGDKKKRKHRRLSQHYIGGRISIQDPLFRFLGERKYSWDWNKFLRDRYGHLYS